MLNPDPVGSAIASYVKSVRPIAGTPVTDAQLTAMWQGIVKIIYDDLKANMQVSPGSLVAADPISGPLPVSGLGGPAV